MNHWIDICCGGGGATQGIIKSGGNVVAAIEYDSRIAEVYRQNFGDHIFNMDLRDFGYSQYKGLNIWASFPCQSFSQARSKSLPERPDKDLSAYATTIFETVQPPYIGMENVRGWLKSEHFQNIINWLDDNLYHYWYDVIDFADYGVPQHRLRAILLASKNHPFVVPPKCHRKITWYDAIADLIPSLNACELAEWQKRAFHKYFAKRGHRDFYLVNEQNENGSPINDSDCTAHTITTRGRMRSVKNCWFINNASESTFRKNNQPAQTLTASNPCYKVAYFSESETIKQILEQAEVYRCSPQVGLRLQTFKDDYKFPFRQDGEINQSLAWKVIGNSVPPQGISMFLESLTRSVHNPQYKQLALL